MLLREVLPDGTALDQFFRGGSRNDYLRSLLHVFSEVIGGLLRLLRLLHHLDWSSWLFDRGGGCWVTHIAVRKLKVNLIKLLKICFRLLEKRPHLIKLRHVVVVVVLVGLLLGRTFCMIGFISLKYILNYLLPLLLLPELIVSRLSEVECNWLDAVRLIVDVDRSVIIC